MEKSIIFFNYRAGSTLCQFLLGDTPRHFKEALLNPHETYGLSYAGWQGSEHCLALPSAGELVPCEKFHGGKTIDEVLAESPPIRKFCWRVFLGDWWGWTPIEQIPEPYGKPDTPMRWDYKTLRDLPDDGGGWKFAVLLRDGRTWIDSTRYFKGGIEEEAQRADPNGYFIRLCKAWRNRSRISLDCEKEIQSFKIFYYEDLIRDPVLITSQILRQIGIQGDAKLLTERASIIQGSSQGHAHSSFGSNEPRARWKSWSNKEKEIFISIAGKELVDLGYATSDSWALEE